MPRWLREPLVHFLLIGALLFVVAGAVGGGSDPESRRVEVTAGVIERLAATFRATWLREPTRAELEKLVDDFTKEELYYREALAMGLDRDDTIVRRRLRQKLEYLAGDLAGDVEPTEDDLTTWLAAHPDDYRRSTVFDLEQVYVRGDDSVRAAAALDALRRGADPASVADPLHVPAAWNDATTRALEATFGAAFTGSLATLPVGEWSGPITSGYGHHLVRIERRVPGEVARLEEVRSAVRRDLVADRRARAERQFFDRLRERYTVTVDWPDAP